MRPLPLERVDAAPSFLLGLAVIRGDVTPVVDAAVLLTGQAAPATRFVTLRVDGRRVALAVTGVVGARLVDDDLPAGLPPLLSGSADVRRALGVLDGRLLEVLESARIIDAAASIALEAVG
jgi:purine-binding chemotaxis protein CheW